MLTDLNENSLIICSFKPITAGLVFSAILGNQRAKSALSYSTMLFPGTPETYLGQELYHVKEVRSFTERDKLYNEATLKEMNHFLLAGVRGEVNEILSYKQSALGKINNSLSRNASYLWNGCKEQDD